MAKPNTKEADGIEKTIAWLQDWKPLIKTIASDNGKEFANHPSIKDALIEGVIKEDDPESKSGKYASYIPFWA